MKNMEDYLPLSEPSVAPVYEKATEFSKISIDCEPKRKKRCVRFPSDLSSEDPSLIGDSGFAEFSLNSRVEENGDQQPTSFLNVMVQGNSNERLFEVSTETVPSTTIRSSSIDTLSSITEGSVELQYQEEYEEESNCGQITASPLPSSGNSNVSNNSGGSLGGDSLSDPCCSSGPSSRSSSASGTPNDESNPGDQILNYLFSDEDGNDDETEKAIMIQRFISAFRSNPDDPMLRHLLQIILSGPEASPTRQKLRHVTHITDAIRLLKCSKKILVLTGAGISVSCGIPDFRSKGGLYSRVSKVFPGLQDPQSVFDIELFRQDPRPFFLTAKELYPGQFEPSLSHKFIKKLETRGQLLRNYSQNIDTLEKIAGIEKVTMCHGSFATATCIRCGLNVDAEAIKDKVLKGEVAFCPSCTLKDEAEKIKFPIMRSESFGPKQGTGSSVAPESQEVNQTYHTDMPQMRYPEPLPPVVKPDIVFFGEDLPDEFHNNLTRDKHDCDLLLVIGSSMRVRPVSLIPNMIPADVPQILINRQSLPHCNFDIELLGNSDLIISYLCRYLGIDFDELASDMDLRYLEKLPRDKNAVEQEEIIPDREPQSEHDIQALKGCWEPKLNESVTARLPDNSYCQWKPRKFVFEGAEISYDPDDDDDDSCSSSGESEATSEDLEEVQSKPPVPISSSDISFKETEKFKSDVNLECSNVELESSHDRSVTQAQTQPSEEGAKKPSCVAGPHNNNNNVNGNKSN